MERKRNPGNSEREMLSLQGLVLTAFRKAFGDTVIGVNLLLRIHECWATVVVKERNPEIEKWPERWSWNLRNWTVISVCLSKCH